MNDQCETCGIGFYLPSDVCDHCNVTRPGMGPDELSLVLSLFPGADLLGKGFEQEGFCVVRGPELVMGQDVRSFWPARHKFAGIIGGPPCQDCSTARRTDPTGKGLEMLWEFARVVVHAQPYWFLMENVPAVPDFAPMMERVDPGWKIQRFNINAREVGCKQNRLRCFQFGYRTGNPLVIARACCMATEGSRKHRRTFADFCELQGLPREFAMPGLTKLARYRAVGNGVPVPLARVIARAIRGRSVTGNSTAVRLPVRQGSQSWPDRRD